MPDERLHDTPGSEGDESPSKSARKRHMHALQRLGESLLALSERELQDIPIEDPRLIEALREARRISSRSAGKRQLQYIGRLMRDIDPEPIERALASLHRGHREDVEAFHALESLRDDILQRGDAGIEDALQRYPDADRQHLRQLHRQHLREQRLEQPPGAARRLFRYLRELHAGAES